MYSLCPTFWILQNSSWVMSLSSIVLFLFAAMPKNINWNTCTQNTTSRDLCSWLAVCDCPHLMIRTNWAITTLWCNKLPMTLSCILNCISSYWKTLTEPWFYRQLQRLLLVNRMCFMSDWSTLLRSCCTCIKQGFQNCMYDLNGFILLNIVFISSF